MKNTGGPTAESDALLRELARAPAASPLDFELRPGALLGRFEVLRTLGRGGFGTVYEARDTDLGRHVAVKVLRLRERSGRSTGEAREEFKREAATVAQLEHPNIVTVHDFGSDGARSYLVLELLRGETLAQKLVRGPLRAREAAAILLQIVRGLAHAHRQGVIHSDVKPGNVFLREDGSVKLLDFGIARLTGDGPSAGPRGTAAYMAPEQWRGETADARSDLFSAGVVLFQLLSGGLAFPQGARPGAGPAPALRTVAPEAAPALEELTGRALSLDPAARPQSAEAFAAALLGIERTLWDAGAQSEQPYHYLEHFSEADEGWFFGRSLEARRLAALLAGHPMAAVVGPSGAGKSSLVLAGLLPRLRREGPWATLVLRPGARPFARLREGLLATLDGSLACPGEDELRDKPGLAGRLLREHARLRSTRVLVVVDQLEELLANVADPQLLLRFAMALAGAADDADGLTRVVITVREDFLGRLAQLPPLREQLGSNLLVLAPPGEDGLRAALCAPAERLGFTVEPAARDEILNALAGLPAPLPLLQLAASRLWERRDLGHNLLTRAALDGFGGVTGVLAAHAEEVLRGLASDTDRELARAMICALVTGGRTGRQREVDELAQGREAALRVLDHLVRGRIVTSFRGEAGQVVELSHESLITGWDWLAGWLDDAHEALRFRDRVSAAAALWVERGRPAELLWTGRTLEAALEWRASQREETIGAASAFVQAAEARARRERRLRKTLITSASAALALLVAGLALGVRTSREAARVERTRAILAAADGSKDPLASALALLELRDAPEPPGAASIAARILEQPLPSLVHRGHGTGPISVRFSPDGSRVLSSSWDGTARVWPASGSAAPLVLPHGVELSDAVFSPDGASIAAVSRDGVTKLWSANGGEPRVFPGEGQVLHRVRFSPDGTRLVTAGNDRVARLFRVDGQGAPVFLRGHEGTIWWAEFSADGSQLVTASEDTTARIWRADGQGAPLVLRGHTGILRAARFSPDGRHVITSGDDGTARLWSTVGEAPPVVLTGHVGRIWLSAWSQDGTRVATAGLDGSARVWRSDGRGEPLVLRGHGGEVMSVAFHPSGEFVLTGSADGTARIWALEGAAAPISFGRHEMGIVEAVFSPDGARLATISEDRTVRVYPVRLPNAHVFPTGQEGTQTAAAFAPDGATLAAGGVDGVIRLWDVAGRKAPGSSTPPGPACTTSPSAPTGRRLRRSGWMAPGPSTGPTDWPRRSPSPGSK